MPDPSSELRQNVARLVDRIRSGWQSATGISLPSQQLVSGNAVAASLAVEEADLTVTGYDGTETTLAFMFDFSQFDGSDVLI
jgi:hypothetical protein